MTADREGRMSAGVGGGTGRRMQAFVALLRPGQHVAASALHAYSIAPSPSASLCPHLTGRQLSRGPAPPAHSESCPAGCARWPPRSAGAAAATVAPRFGPAAGQVRGDGGNRGRSRQQTSAQPADACVCGTEQQCSSGEARQTVQAGSDPPGRNRRLQQERTRARRLPNSSSSTSSQEWSSSYSRS